MIPSTVPVIASFSTDGKIQPLYVRINGAALKVIQCTAHLEYVHPTFNCVVDDYGIAKKIKLSYNHTTHTWLVIDC